MKIEIVKISNGLGETMYKALEIGEDRGVIGLSHTLEGAELLAKKYKLRSEIKEESLKSYDIQ